jgi:hypothetical protein
VPYLVSRGLAPVLVAVVVMGGSSGLEEDLAARQVLGRGGHHRPLLSSTRVHTMA